MYIAGARLFSIFRLSWQPDRCRSSSVPAATSCRLRQTLSRTGHDRLHPFGAFREEQQARPRYLLVSSEPECISRGLAYSAYSVYRGSPTDVDPRLYRQQPHAGLGKLYPERDTTDFTLLEHSEKNNKPVLGICL